MIRAAAPGDAGQLIALLSSSVRAAMFPLSNLHRGLLRPAGAPLDGAQTMHGWLLGDAGFLGLSGAGYLMPFGPADQDWAALRSHLAGRQVAGVVGPDGTAPAVLAGLGLGTAPRRHASDEPGFSLPLCDLRLPDTTGFWLEPLDARHRDRAIDWRIGYLAEVFGDADATGRAAADVARWIAADSHRMLLRDGLPVAMSGFNAAIPGTVQVGGVWTPPAQRGRGLARRVVALHLDEARRAGVTRAVLFAANDAAATAYRAIGFGRDGSMGVIELAAPAQVPA